MPSTLRAAQVWSWIGSLLSVPTAAAVYCCRRITISPTTGHGRPYNSLKHWGGRRELNPQPSEPQSDALPIELLPPQTLIVQTTIITTAAGLVVSLARLKSSHAHVLESHGAQAGRGERIFGGDEEWGVHQVGDLGEIP